MARRLAFRPRIHGFKFANNFSNNFSNEITGILPGFNESVSTKGLCGGMVLAAFNYYRYGLPIPPNQGNDVNYNVSFDVLGTSNSVSSLLKYIYDSQLASFESLEIVKFILQPGPSYTGEFQAIRATIDDGRYAMIGLRSRSGDSGAGHQVLCYGHDGPNRLFIYDPNYPLEELVVFPAKKDGKDVIKLERPEGALDERYEGMFLLHRLDTAKSPDQTSYNPVHNALHNLAVRPPIPKQEPGWRWCSKCEVLFYHPRRSQSVCAAGGRHDGSGSSKYRLLKGYSESGHSRGWSRCLKCQALAYAPDVAGSYCPAGERHQHFQISQTLPVLPSNFDLRARRVRLPRSLVLSLLFGNEYTILKDKAGNRSFTQRGWRRCPKCQALHHENGTCAADQSAHGVAQAGRYSLLT